MDQPPLEQSITRRGVQVPQCECVGAQRHRAQSDHRNQLRPSRASVSSEPRERNDQARQREENKDQRRNLLIGELPVPVILNGLQPREGGAKDRERRSEPKPVDPPPWRSSGRVVDYVRLPVHNGPAFHARPGARSFSIHKDRDARRGPLQWLVSWHRWTAAASVHHEVPGAVVWVAPRQLILDPRYHARHRITDVATVEERLKLVPRFPDPRALTIGIAQR